MLLLTDEVCNTDVVQEREPQDKDSLKGTVIIYSCPSKPERLSSVEHEHKTL